MVGIVFVSLMQLASSMQLSDMICASFMVDSHNYSVLETFSADKCVCLVLTTSPVETVKWLSAITKLTVHCTCATCVLFGDLRLQTINP